MNKEKLRELGEDLTTDQLAVDKFLFTRYFQDRSNHKNSCGTVGCALGHYTVKSDDWEFKDEQYPHLKDGNGSGPIGDARDYFDIPYHVAEFIFIPHDDAYPSDVDRLNYIYEKYNLHPLPDKPPANHVGENILKIIDMDEPTFNNFLEDLINLK